METENKVMVDTSYEDTRKILGLKTRELKQLESDLRNIVSQKHPQRRFTKSQTSSFDEKVFKIHKVREEIKLIKRCIRTYKFD